MALKWKFVLVSASLLLSSSIISGKHIHGGGGGLISVESLLAAGILAKLLYPFGRRGIGGKRYGNFGGGFGGPGGLTSRDIEGLAALYGLTAAMGNTGAGVAGIEGELGAPFAEYGTIPHASGGFANGLRTAGRFSGLSNVGGGLGNAAGMAGVFGGLGNTGGGLGHGIGAGGGVGGLNGASVGYGNGIGIGNGYGGIAYNQQIENPSAIGL